jgi:hypothetical protein
LVRQEERLQADLLDRPPDMGSAVGYVKRGPEIAVSRQSFAPLAPAYA